MNEKNKMVMTQKQTSIYLIFVEEFMKGKERVKEKIRRWLREETGFISFIILSHGKSSSNPWANTASVLLIKKKTKNTAPVFLTPNYV